MIELWRLFRGDHHWRRQALWLLLSLAALGASLGLLALAGWFVVAAGLAGMGLLLLRDIHSPSAGIRALALARVALRYGENLYGHDLLFRRMSALRLSLFGALRRRGSPRLYGLDAAGLFDRIITDLLWLEQVLPRLLWPLAAAQVLLLALTALALWRCPPLGLLLAALWLVLTTLIALALRAGRRLAERERTLETDRHWRMEALLETSGSLRQFGRLDAHIQAVANLDTRRHVLARRRHLLESLLDGSWVLAGALAVLGMMWLVHAECQPAQGAGPLVAMAALFTLGLVELLRALPAAWLDGARLRNTAAGLNRWTSEVGGNDQRCPANNAHSNQQQEGCSSLSVESRGLALQAVTLRGPRDGRLLADRLDLACRPGQPLLICGESGVGKSRLLAAIAGLVAPEAGEIRLDGRLLSTMPDGERHRHVGLLGQQSVMLTGTVADNLRLGAPTADEAALWAVLEKVGLAEMLQGREGLGTEVGQGGAGFSGGECRRLALARLMLADPPCVLLDEPFTGLDAASRDALMPALNAWLSRRIAVLALHEPPPSLAAGGGTAVRWLRAGRLIRDELL